MAEMASVQPIAGAQYHWTHYLAPPSHRRFITWMQGWITWFSWISLLAGVANIAALMIQALVIASYPDYVPKGCEYAKEPWPPLSGGLTVSQGTSP
jgi:choline transport protein